MRSAVVGTKTPHRSRRLRERTDYVMAVNADVPHIDVDFLDFPDKEINELGARGIGEIGWPASLQP